MQAATIKLFLPAGDATGIRTAEISNWTGKAVAGPRTEIGELLKRSELNGPCVYLLLGADPNGDPLVYIGETEDVKERFKKHRVKEFWAQAIVFTSKDNNLTKAHIKFLEGELIGRALSVAKATLDNGQGSKANLPESDEAEMRVFLSKMYQLLPVLGTDVFAPAVEKVISPSSVLYCAKAGTKAMGQRTSSGFVVFKDSQAVVEETPSIPPSIRAAREKLIKKGVLVLSDDVYVFAVDHECSSPSLAAAIVRGGSANGMVEWKDKDGKTLKQLEG